MKVRAECIFLFLIVSLFSRTHAECVNGTVRLRGGSAFEGRVEYCVNGQWGQVCAMGFTRVDAEVVCHQLGHDRINAIRASASQNGPYGGENEVAVVTNVACAASHNKLSQCSLQLLNGSSTCASLSGPAAVVCQDPMCVTNRDSVRLSEEQVVEVCAGGRYRTGVCSDNWDDIDATVVCRQLDEGEVGVANSTGSGFYRTQQAYQNVSCTGSEDTLSNCSHDLIRVVNPIERCSSGQWARAICQDADSTTTDDVTTPRFPTTLPPGETTSMGIAATTPTGGSTIDPSTTTDQKPNPTSTATTTSQVTTDPSSTGTLGGNDSLLAIVLGAVGGLIALLLFGIVVLLVLIILGKKRRKYTMQHLENSPNGHAVMMTSTQVKAVESSTLTNSYSSHKGEPERLLFNPLYLTDQQQTANTNPLPYTSIVTPPSTAGEDSQIHEYATLDNFQPPLPPWPPQSRTYSSLTNPVSGGEVVNALPAEAANAYSEPVYPAHHERQISEDGVITDQEGYAALDPNAHSYDYPQVNGAACNGAEGVATLPVPQPYQTPLESSYEDASSTNISRSSTPLSMNGRRESPEHRGDGLLGVDDTVSPYMEPVPSPTPHVTPPTADERNTVSSPTHDYATLEPPK